MVGSIYRRDFRDVAVSFYNGTCNCWSYVMRLVFILIYLSILNKPIHRRENVKNEILRGFRFLKKLVILVRMALIDSNSKIKIQGQLWRISEDSDNNGTLLWIIPFNIYLEKVVRKIKTDLVEQFSRDHIQWAEEVRDQDFCSCRRLLVWNGVGFRPFSRQLSHRQ